MGGQPVTDSDGFHDFVARRSAPLLRSAWLLTGDEASAQDLVQTALAKTWVRWAQVVRKDEPSAYVRRVMTSTFLTWRRRRWRGEIPMATTPDAADAGDETDCHDLRQCVRVALQELPAGQRAVVVLRYFDDLSEAQAAAALGCTVGTVKSQTSRALVRLRASAALAGLWDEEVRQ